MIVYKTGNLLDDDADVLVNPVNCVGVMGAGLAKQFKEKYPKMFKKYKEGCDLGKYGMASVIYHHTGCVYICNFPTKYHYKSNSYVDEINNGLLDMVKKLPHHCYTVAIPKLGCGLGGLNWETQVKPLFEKYLEPSNVEYRVYV